MADNTRKAVRGGTYTIFVAIFSQYSCNRNSLYVPLYGIYSFILSTYTIPHFLLKRKRGRKL